MKSAAALFTLVASSAVVSANRHGSINARHAQVVRSLSGRDATPPAGWATDILEPYEQYHIRYLAIDCEAYHNTVFFNDCCHPLLKGETINAAWQPECIPTAAQSSSAAAEVATASPLSGAAISYFTTASSSDVVSATSWADATSSSSAVAPSVSVASQPAFIPSSSAPLASSSSQAAPPPPPSSTYSQVAPPPSTSSSYTPVSSAAPPPPPATSSAPPAAASSASGSGNNGGGLPGAIGAIQSGGIGTYFYQNGVAGACGIVHADTDTVVALPPGQYGNGENCGRQLTIQDINTGNTATATVADMCPTCDNDQCLDMSLGLFLQFALTELGEFPIQWAYTS